MTVLQPEPATTAPGSGPPTDPGGPPRFRHVVGALSMPGLVLALLATGPLDPFDDQASATVQLGQLPGHVAEVRALGWVELLAAALFASVVLAFAGHTRGRGRGVANAGVVLGVLGTVGMALIAMRHWLLVSVDALPRHQAADVVGRLDTTAGPGVLPLLVAAPVALVLFAVAGHRAGFVPLPALLLTVAFFVGELVSSLPGGELVPLLLELVALSWTAWTLLRRVPAAPVKVPEQVSASAG
jgi:hypothetical protein